MNIQPIAYIHTDFSDKFGIPRQSGMTSLRSEIVFEREYSEEAFRGLTDYDYIWLIWGFDRAKQTGSLTVRPPRLGGNKRMGVFATRSPYRPNGLGLSSVKLLGIEHGERMILTVEGADLADGTPIYDVKPYLPYTDSHEQAKAGFSVSPEEHLLSVVFPTVLQGKIPPEKRDDLLKILSFDPRPSYQDEGRPYGFVFADREIKFTVSNGVLTVTDVFILSR